MNMKANADHFFEAFEHCLKCKMTKKQAIVMSIGFSKRGMVDASEGCSHYVMRLMRWTSINPNWFARDIDGQVGGYVTIVECAVPIMSHFVKQIGRSIMSSIMALVNPENSGTYTKQESSPLNIGTMEMKNLRLTTLFVFLIYQGELFINKLEKYWNELASS